MNKQQLFTAGSVLLATTSLAGVANAGIVALPASVALGNTVGTATAAVATKVANVVFSTTAATANSVQVGPTAVYVAFSNNFTPASKFSVELDPIGASFVQTGKARLLLASPGSYGATMLATDAACGVTPLTTKIILDNCGGAISQTAGVAVADVSASYAGVLFSGVTFNNAAALAGVGATIGVSGTVSNGNSTQVYETIPATTIVTSAAAFTTSITAGGTATVDAKATPVAFSYFTAGSAVGTANLTATLAIVNLTSTGVFSNDLHTVLTPDAGAAGGISSIQVTVTAPVLSEGAITSLYATIPNTGVVIAGTNNATVANFAGGVATFSLDAATGFTSFAIVVTFSGTAAITAASAGTVAINFAAGGVAKQANAAVTGKTGTITLGGFQAELNTFLGSSNTSFSSFARIHNNGSLAAPAIVTVRNDATGATMGTYTTATIAANETLQISAKDIETGASIAAADGVNYTLTIGGAFSGYAQHIIFNPMTGQLADLSSFRNHGSPAGTQAP